MRAAGPSRPAAAFAVAVCLALGLSACSLASEAPPASPEEELPTARFTNYSHTVVDKGETRLVLKAASAAVYEASKRTELVDVRFSEYDTATGELSSSGRADKAVYHNDTKDAEFLGSVRLESKSQDAVLEGEYLRWSDKDKRLQGKLESTVKISRGDGSSVTGAGFEANARSRSFAFRDSVEGRIAESEEGRSEASPPASPAAVPPAAEAAQ